MATQEGGSVIDSKELALFFAEPDAAQIIESFNRLKGPLRQSLLMSIELIAAREPGHLAPDQKLITDDRFFSTSVEGRVGERALRGQTAEEIAELERLKLPKVHTLMRAAARARGEPVAKKAKAPKVETAPAAKAEKPATAYTGTMTLVKDQVIALRMAGYAPQTIAAHFDLRPGGVHTVLYEAKKAGKVFPVVNDEQARITMPLPVPEAA
jgi:hypothetical protein